MRAQPALLFGSILSALVLLPSCTQQGASAAESTTSSRVPAVERAVCVLSAVGDSGVSGQIELRRDGDAVRVTGEVRGLEPGPHGFHVHEFGDLTAADDGKSAGGHFAPRGHEHGRPGEQARHVGDLGNIEADDEGIAKVDITDTVIALDGEHSILGRALVVHSGKDTFGQPSGDAGGRVAFGVIGRAGD